MLLHKQIALSENVWGVFFKSCISRTSECRIVLSVLMYQLHECYETTFAILAIAEDFLTYDVYNDVLSR